MSEGGNRFFASGACGLAINRDLNIIVSMVIRPSQIREFQTASRNANTGNCSPIKGEVPKPRVEALRGCPQN